jgi:hypothetical protein
MDVSTRNQIVKTWCTALLSVVHRVGPDIRQAAGDESIHGDDLVDLVASHSGMDGWPTVPDLLDLEGPEQAEIFDYASRLARGI